MPDAYGFDNLPWQGRFVHRCVECEWPGWGRVVSEADRARHHDGHERERLKAVEKTRKANLANARKSKRVLAKENSLAYQEGTDDD
jgi:hypothetical protein